VSPVKPTLVFGGQETLLAHLVEESNLVHLDIWW